MDLPFDLDAEVVRLIKAKSVELPTYPGVALQLQRVISSGNFGVSDLAKLVEADQALATAVMRTANSAFYGVSSPITTLQAAISRVGSNALKNIVLAGTLGVQGSLDGPLAPLRKDSWRRSLISGLLCQLLAPQRKLDEGEAFLAGLLHDFGETIAYACFEKLFEAHPKSRPQSAASWLAEAQRYHVELGMALAAEWKLPDFISAAVMRHHDADLEGADFPALVGLVAMCDTITARLSEASSLDELVLTGIAGLALSEQTSLKAVLHEVPAFLESFDVPSPKAARPVPSMVAPVATTLGARAKRVQFPLAVTTRDSRAAYQAVEMSPSALRMEGEVPQAERRLIHLELGGGVKVYATVMACLSAGAGWTIEAKPFAMDRPSQAAWAQLLNAA